MVRVCVSKNGTAGVATARLSAVFPVCKVKERPHEYRRRVSRAGRYYMKPMYLGITRKQEFEYFRPGWSGHGGLTTGILGLRRTPFLSPPPSHPRTPQCSDLKSCHKKDNEKCWIYRRDLEEEKKKCRKGKNSGLYLLPRNHEETFPNNFATGGAAEGAAGTEDEPISLAASSCDEVGMPFLRI